MILQFFSLEILLNDLVFYMDDDKLMIRYTTLYYFIHQQQINFIKQNGVFYMRVFSNVKNFHEAGTNFGKKYLIIHILFLQH